MINALDNICYKISLLISYKLIHSVCTLQEGDIKNNAILKNLKALSEVVKAKENNTKIESNINTSESQNILNLMQIQIQNEMREKIAKNPEILKEIINFNSIRDGNKSNSYNIENFINNVIREIYDSAKENPLTFLTNKLNGKPFWNKDIENNINEANPILANEIKKLPFEVPIIEIDTARTIFNKIDSDKIPYNKVQLNTVDPNSKEPKKNSVTRHTT
jgi:hypothetical protein